MALMLVSSVGATQNDVPVGNEQIKLRGSLDLNAGPNSIEASVGRDAICIHFYQNFGNVNISIYNGYGALVYSTVVNTAVQQLVIIPTTGFSSGTYTLELSNAFGFVEGDFML